MRIRIHGTSHIADQCGSGTATGKIATTFGHHNFLRIDNLKFSLNAAEYYAFLNTGTVE